ncbi:hypothetical protein AN7934.2 [Aspergillus nidulans FGSC A4]|nr:hypothetical protein AN7934.2 [Aspergillus nidulans FGSC A4]|eukprot:XP_681203.1 hypothetical protein AN7934.2 [Aspergillus nidulans FGSC A4]
MVSDTTLYMILSVFRNFTRTQLAARTADPEIFTASHKLIASISHNPRGHILGLVGLGNISKKVVDEEALIEALETGSPSAAGLDVHYHEPQVSPRLAAMDAVTLITHIAGGALNTRINFELNSMENILATVGAQGELIGQPFTPVNSKQVLEYLKAQT